MVVENEALLEGCWLTCSPCRHCAIRKEYYRKSRTCATQVRFSGARCYEIRLAVVPQKLRAAHVQLFFGTPGAELLCLLHMDQHGHAAVERSHLRNRPAGRLLSAVESLLQHQIGPNVWGVRNAPLHSLVARAAVGRKEGKFTTPLAAN